MLSELYASKCIGILLWPYIPAHSAVNFEMFHESNDLSMA